MPLAEPPPPPFPSSFRPACSWKDWAGPAPGRLAASGRGNAARWHAHVASYTPAERASWPLTYGQLTSGAMDARASVLFSA